MSQGLGKKQQIAHWNDRSVFLRDLSHSEIGGRRVACDIVGRCPLGECTFVPTCHNVKHFLKILFPTSLSNLSCGISVCVVGPVRPAVATAASVGSDQASSTVH